MTHKGWRVVKPQLNQKKKKKKKKKNKKTDKDPGQAERSWSGSTFLVYLFPLLSILIHFLWKHGKQANQPV